MGCKRKFRCTELSEILQSHRRLCRFVPYKPQPLDKLASCRLRWKYLSHRRCRRPCRPAGIWQFPESPSCRGWKVCIRHCNPTGARKVESWCTKRRRCYNGVQKISLAVATKHSSQDDSVREATLLTFRGKIPRSLNCCWSPSKPLSS